MIPGTQPTLLAALAAAFAPARAATVLGRTPAPAAAAEAARLAPLARAERLEALAVALAALPQPPPCARELAAGVERPRVAARMRRPEIGPGGNLLARLIEEAVLAAAPSSGNGSAGSQASPCAGTAEPPGPPLARPVRRSAAGEGRDPLE